MWHQRIQSFRRNFQFEGEAFTESDLFQFQVTPNEIQLGGQGGFLEVLALQEQPEQLAELPKHSVRGLWLVVDLGCDPIERVKEKMRVQLRFKRVQARLD